MYDYRFSFTRPESITNTTSGIVTPVSAMLVASTILRTPHGGTKNTFDCSADEREECKPSTIYLPAQHRQTVSE